MDEAAEDETLMLDRSLGEAEAAPADAAAEGGTARYTPAGSQSTGKQADAESPAASASTFVMPKVPHRPTDKTVELKSDDSTVIVVDMLEELSVEDQTAQAPDADSTPPQIGAASDDRTFGDQMVTEVEIDYDAQP